MINIDLDTMFANSQQLANLLKDDPNPHRTAYARLIGELEAALLDAYRDANKKGKSNMEAYLASIIRRQRKELAKRREDAEVAQRIENFAD